MLERDVYAVLGLPFDSLTLDESAKELARFVNEERRCFLSTPNLNFVVSARSDSAFFGSVLESDLVIADGMPIVWVAKLLGIPIRERVAGSSLFNLLSKQKFLDRKMRVFFFGGESGVAEASHHTLNETSVGMESCGYYDPGFISVDEMSTPDILNQINQSRPDFLVVALGAKKGQEWIQKNKAVLTVPVVSHLGAVINFVAGTVKRAPLVWQKFGVEWLWRIKQEPGLWKRYLWDGLSFIKLFIVNVIPLVFINILADKLASRVSDIDVGVSLGGLAKLVLQGNAFVEKPDDIKHAYALILEQFSSNVVIDCTNLEYIDSAGIASLLLFQSELKVHSRTLVLSDLSWKVRLLFKLNQVWDRFSIQ
jgi:N-acetylglucosaminyldiphosphoundecaprenol N-acetyl-beta-D-mannosaminyltransferase